MYLKLQLSNISFYVLLFSVFLSIVIYFRAENTSQLIQIYALTAISFLYFTLLATPLTKTFTFIPYRGQYIKARRALGVSAFYFGFIHGNLAFFNNIGGLEGLFALQGKLLLAVIFGEISLFILFLMT